MTAPTPCDLTWRALTAEQWRGYRQDRLTAGWRVVDGALTRVSAAIS